MHDLDEADANRFLTRLHEANIPSDKIKQANGQWAIAVEKSDSINAIKTLSDARMFKNNQNDAPQKSSLVSSKEDQRFHYERAVSHELERTLSGMPEVLDARVHLNMPASDPIFGNRLPEAKGSGSVMLVVSDRFTSNMAQIKELISGAAGIDKAAISILVTRESRPAASAPVAVAATNLLPTKQPQSFETESMWVPDGKFSYLLSGVLLALMGLFIIIKHFNSKSSKKSKNLNEDDLYELARDFN